MSYSLWQNGEMTHNDQSVLLPQHFHTHTCLLNQTPKYRLFFTFDFKHLGGEVVKRKARVRKNVGSIQGWFITNTLKKVVVAFHHLRLWS